VAGLAVGGAGLAAVVTGAVFGLQARAKGDSVSGAKVFDPAADQAGHRAQTLQYVFYGVGAAALAAGGILYYLGLDRGPGDAGVALAPTFTSRSAGVALGGRF
jgi:hypothetical protein